MKYQAPIDAADPDDPYVDLDVIGGIDGSPVPAAAIEHTQREIVNVITAAGIVPDDADLTQLENAILQLIADNTSNTEVATNVESDAGVLTDKALSPANFGAQNTLAANGYQKLPGGLIIQWGSGTTPGGGVVSVTLPLAFPNNFFSVVPAVDGLATGGIEHVQYANKTLSGFDVYTITTGGIAANFQWIAIGN